MSHPFENKLFVFIGNPIRCSRREAIDALTTVNGVIEERISTFTDFAVEFYHNGMTKKHKIAVEHDRKGCLVLLNESQFFDILEGKTKPPDRSEHVKPTLVKMKGDFEAYSKQLEKNRDEMLNQKRINNMAKYGITMPDGSITKVDLRPLDITRRILELMKTQPDHVGYVIVGTPYDKCDVCDNPIKVHINNNRGDEYGKLCEDCYNKLMAEFTGTVVPDIIPKQLSVKDNKGKIHHFDLEFMIFANGKMLTAIERGPFKYKAEVHGELYIEFETMLKALKHKLKKELSIKYMDDKGRIANGIAVGYIEYNSKRDACDIIIDGKPYTWSDLEKNIPTHEGWKIKIEFGDFDDVLE